MGAFTHARCVDGAPLRLHIAEARRHGPTKRKQFSPPRVNRCDHLSSPRLGRQAPTGASAWRGGHADVAPQVPLQAAARATAGDLRCPTLF